MDKDFCRAAPGFSKCLDNVWGSEMQKDQICWGVGVGWWGVHTDIETNRTTE